MKKFIPILGALVVALNLMALSFTATAQQNVISDGDDGLLVCKWYRLICESGNQQEACLTDGDGNICSCGTVTRPC